MKGRIKGENKNRQERVQKNITKYIQKESKTT